MRLLQAVLWATCVGITLALLTSYEGGKLAPADRERVQEQTHKVLRIEIEKHEREHLRKIPH